MATLEIQSETIYSDGTWSERDEVVKVRDGYYADAWDAAAEVGGAGDGTTAYFLANGSIYYGELPLDGAYVKSVEISSASWIVENEANEIAAEMLNVPGIIEDAELLPEMPDEDVVMYAVATRGDYRLEIYPSGVATLVDLRTGLGSAVSFSVVEAVVDNLLGKG